MTVRERDRGDGRRRREKADGVRLAGERESSEKECRRKETREERE